MKKNVLSSLPAPLLPFLLSLILLSFAFLLRISPAAAAPASDDERAELVLEASPVSPYPGETVRVQAKVTPRFDEARNAVRWEWQGGVDNFRAIGENQAAYEACKDAATLTATLWDRVDGRDVKTVVLAVVPQSYRVEVRDISPVAIDRKIRLWDDNAKKMTEVQGRSPFSRSLLEAVVAPLPPDASRYVWTPNVGSFVVSQDQNRCTVYRDSTGPCIVSLSVFDKNNQELGAAQLSFDVSLSLQAVEQSNRLSGGWNQWEKALAMRNRGEVESAWAVAQKAAEELTEGGMKDDSLRDELARFKQTRDDYFRATETATIAASIWRDGRLEEALAKYREARSLYPHADIEKNIAEIEEILKHEAELKKNAASAAKEAGRLASDGKLKEALGKYAESLRLFSDAEVRSAQADAEGRLKAILRKTEIAEAQREIALALEYRGELEQAFSKMSEARETWPSPAIAADMKRIQSALSVQQNLKNEASELAEEASRLESRGMGGQGNTEILTQAQEKYRQASKKWPDPSLDRSIQRLERHVGRIEAQIAQAALFVKEADLLERDQKFEEALNKYRRALDMRRSGDIEKKIAMLEQRIESNKKFFGEVRAHRDQAVELERQGKFDEAIAAARKGETLLSSNALASSDVSFGELPTVLKRLQNAIRIRDEKAARAAALASEAEKARGQGNLEKSLELYIESDNIWKNEDVAQAIQTLRGLVNEHENTEKRAEELYKEAVVLERESRLEAAEEKLQSSLTLKHTPEAETLLSKVTKARTEKAWFEALLSQPLDLRIQPLVPRTGQRTTVRIEDGAWTDDGLTYRWKLLGNVKENIVAENGRACNFYPADDHPVTVELTVLQSGTERELATRTASATAEPYSVKLVLNERSKTAKLWNPTLKRLEEVNEFSTGADLEVRAEILPLPDGAVAYFWSADPNSVIAASKDNIATVRRTLPGTSNIAVTAKDVRGIEFGSAKISFSVAVDKKDVIRDLARSQGWAKWTTAQSLWDAGDRLRAIETATQASLSDPSDPDITAGLSRMKEDLGKIEHAARLLSESSSLLSSGKIDEAEEKAIEAEKLHPGEANTNIKYAISEAAEKYRKKRILAEKLRAEGEALLASGLKIEALLRFQSSLLLEEDEIVSKDAARLIAETAKEKHTREEARTLREKGYAMADKKRYAEAFELFSLSLRLRPDAYLENYAMILKERTGEEKIAREEASRLRKEGDALLKNKKTAEALLKYKESLTYAIDATAEAYVKKAETEEAQKRVESLIKTGDALLKEKKPEEALSNYRLAQKNAPNNKALVEKIQKLELILAPASVEDPISGDGFSGDPYAGEAVPDSADAQDPARAEILFKEANALYKQKKYREAVLQYEESYKYSRSPKLREFIDQLKGTLGNVEKANNLVQEANALYKNKKYKDALGKYKESLKFHKNPQVEAFIPKVEAQVK